MLGHLPELKSLKLQAFFNEREYRTNASTSNKWLGQHAGEVLEQTRLISQRQNSKRELICRPARRISSGLESSEFQYFL